MFLFTLICGSRRNQLQHTLLGTYLWLTVSLSRTEVTANIKAEDGEIHTSDTWISLLAGVHAPNYTASCHQKWGSSLCLRPICFTSTLMWQCIYSSQHLTGLKVFSSHYLEVPLLVLIHPIDQPYPIRMRNVPCPESWLHIHTKMNTFLGCQHAFGTTPKLLITCNAAAALLLLAKSWAW